MNSPETPFLPHGGYRKLRSYKLAEAVYDAAVVFCRRFYAHDRRMSDQMVQAARSGVRNISEGSGAAATSRKTERVYGARSQARKSDRSDTSARLAGADAPGCPMCGRPMVQRIARKGPRVNQAFWGCSGYPDCKGTLALSPPDKTDPPVRSATRPQESP